jgi:HK97 family phage prohead protease
MNDAYKKYTDEAAKSLHAVLVSFKAQKDQGEGDFEVIASNENVDRDGEIIKVEGWNFDKYQKNPVLLWGHDYTLPPIGIVTTLTKGKGQLIAKGTFAKSAFAQEVRSLYDEGILKAVSVGFIPLERDGSTITKAELLELSFVSVPANADAVSLRRMKDFKDKISTFAIKGDVADLVVAVQSNTEETMNEKMELLDEVASIYWAMIDLAMRPENTADDVKELVIEAAQLMLAKKEEEPVEEETPVEEDSQEDEEISMNEPVDEEETIPKHIKNNKEKALEFVEAIKSGRVLSAKNKDLVSQAIDALQALIDATDTEKSYKNVSSEELMDVLVAGRVVDKAIEQLNRTLKSSIGR